MDNKNKKCIIETLTFWDKLNFQQQESILNNTNYKLYQKGENIHGLDNECAGILLINSGELRTYLLSEDGKEIWFMGTDLFWTFYS